MSIMSETYYQFPLSLLAGFNDEMNMIQAVTSYCAVTIGESLVPKSPKERRAFAEEVKAHFGPENPMPQGIYAAHENDLAIIAGFQKLGMHGGSATRVADDYKHCQKIVCELHEIQGQSPLVRFRSDVMWAPIRETMTLRQWRVLAAVYSSIGAKQFPLQITRDMIRARAIGYKSASLIFDDAGYVHDAGRVILEKRADKAAPLLTVDKLRWTLDELEARGWFHRCHASKRRTYFSHRMTREAMLAWFKQNPPASRKVEKLRSADAKLRSELAKPKRQKPIIVGNQDAPIIVGTTSEQSPQSPHSTPTESPVSPHECPHECPHINKTSLIETSLIKEDGEHTQKGCVPSSFSLEKAIEELREAAK